MFRSFAIAAFSLLLGKLPAEHLTDKQLQRQMDHYAKTKVSF